MARNEDGELELVLGNTQLLSFFFVVVGLLGGFFAIGWFVGRTSAPPVLADTQTTARAESKPIVVESTAETPPSETPEAKPKPFETPSPRTEKTAPKEKPQPITTAPQQDVESLPKPEPLPAAAKEEAKKDRPSQPKDTKKKERAKAEKSAVEDTAAGKTYLQLSATKRAEAETYVDVLKKKGFIAIAARVPEKGDMYRVLVGPVADAQINKTRADLQKSGFPGDKALRKKF